MKLNKDALKLKRENRAKLREIYETAYQSDLDRGAVRDYIKLQAHRPHYKEAIVGAVAAGVGTAIVGSLTNGLPLDHPSVIGPSILAAFCGGLGGYTLRSPSTIYNSVTAYLDARQDSLKNYPSLEAEVTKE